MAGGVAGTRDGLSSVTRGTLLMLLGTLGWVAENFVARVLLVRGLPPAEWGEFSLGLALVGLLTAFGALGLPAAVARNLPFATNDSERRSIVRSAFAVVAPTSVILTGVLFAYGAYLAAGGALLGFTLELFALSIAFSVLSGLIAAVFQGYEDVLPNALFAQIINPTLFIIFLVASTGIPPYFRLTYTEALVAYLAANVITLGALVVYARRKLPRLLPPGPRAPFVSRRLFLFAAPLFVVGVLGIVTQNGDTILLGVYNLSQVGFYTAPLSLGRLILVGLGSLGYIFLPVASRFVRENNGEAMRVTYATATKWMVLTSLPLFLLFFFLPGGALRFVYGATYSASSTPLRILVLGAFLSTLVGPAFATQVAYGQTRLLMYNTAVSAVADVGLSIALIPMWGITGAAVAWAISNALFPILSTAQLAYLEDVHPFRAHYLIPLLVTSVPLAILFALFPFVVPFWVLPLIVVGIALLFVIAVVVTRSIDDGDRMLLEVVEGFLGHRIPLVRWLGRLGGRRAGPRPPG